MIKRVTQVLWTRQARESLSAILDYRYASIPSAYKIVKDEIIAASKGILFSGQYQKDEIFSEYRRIIIRDYKILYKEENSKVFIMNLVCTKAQ